MFFQKRSESRGFAPLGIVLCVLILAGCGLAEDVGPGEPGDLRTITQAGGGGEECGNATCEPEFGEDCETCPIDCFDDCTPTCGDGTCDDVNGEDCLSCPDDCFDDCLLNCGDGTCDDTDGENCETCPDDCAVNCGPNCGDGTCDGADNEDCETCPLDCSDSCAPDCGDGTCESEKGEDCETCDTDCFDDCMTCGDGTCDIDSEDCDSCPIDCTEGCTPDCGDGTCDSATGEDCLSCPGDCTEGCTPDCGDGTCDDTMGEDCDTCPSDCTEGCTPNCGDGTCDSAAGEDCASCSSDCSCMDAGMDADTGPSDTGPDPTDTGPTDADLDVDADVPWDAPDVDACDECECDEDVEPPSFNIDFDKTWELGSVPCTSPSGTGPVGIDEVSIAIGFMGEGAVCGNDCEATATAMAGGGALLQLCGPSLDLELTGQLGLDRTYCVECDADCQEYCGAGYCEEKTGDLKLEGELEHFYGVDPSFDKWGISGQVKCGVSAKFHVEQMLGVTWRENMGYDCGDCKDCLSLKYSGGGGAGVQLSCFVELDVGEFNFFLGIENAGSVDVSAWAGGGYDIGGACEEGACGFIGGRMDMGVDTGCNQIQLGWWETGVQFTYMPYFCGESTTCDSCSANCPDCSELEVDNWDFGRCGDYVDEGG